MKRPPIKVLLIEDSSSEAELLQTIFDSSTVRTFDCDWSESLKAGLARIQRGGVDVVLLDLSLPDSYGLNTYRAVRGQAPELPVVILTGSDDEQLGLQAVREGAQEYLVKGTLEARMLTRVLRYAIERKRAEEALRDREEFFRLISESMTDLIAVIDRSGRRLYNSPSYRRLLGDPDALRGTDSFEEVHPEDREKIRQVFLETLATGEGRRAEYRFITPAGSIRHLESQGSVILDRQGKPGKVVVISRDITDRKLAEEALRESEQRYKRLLRSTTDYIYSTHLENGRVKATEHGPGCEGVTGYRPEEYSADPELWLGMVHEEDRDAVLEQARQVNAGITPPPLEHRIRHKNGAIRWVRHTTVLRRDEQGRLIGCDGLISDISARREAEERLKYSEALYHSLVETLPQSILRKDLQGRFTFVNHHFAESLSKKPEEILGKTDFDLFPEDLAVKYQEDDRRIIAAGKMFETIEAHRNVEGDRFVHVVKTPIFDAHGHATGIQGIFWDITERRRGEEALKESEERLQAILDNTPAVVYMKDRQGRYLVVNRAYETIFKLQRDRILGQSDLELFPREMAEAFRANDRKVLQTGQPLEFEETALLDDGPHTYISVKFALRDVAGRVYAVCGISTDITERKHAEAILKRKNEELSASEEALTRALADLRRSHEELKHTQLQLIQAEKMESIGGLAAGVAHEVKNPLQTIVMGTRYLTRALGDKDATVQQVLQDIRDAVHRADTIVKGLLEFAAPRELTLTREPINEVLAESLKLVNYAVTDHGVQVVREFAETLPPLTIDKAKMEQVFINLFMNAIHAMPGGGTLTVRTGYRFIASGEINPEDRGEGDTYRTGQMVVAVEIEDTGHGIPQEKLTKVFDPFFTTKAPGKGTGLVLTVVKRIVEMNGGVIDIRNRKEGGGVRVTLIFKPGRRPAHEPQETHPRR
jgi:PAS domain S-box-containing protein